MTSSKSEFELMRRRIINSSCGHRLAGKIADFDYLKDSYTTPAMPDPNEPFLSIRRIKKIGPLRYPKG
jgi:hypothetical protein